MRSIIHHQEAFFLSGSSIPLHYTGRNSICQRYLLVFYWRPHAKLITTRTQTIINHGALADSHTSAVITPPPLANGGSIDSPSPEEYTNGYDWHEVPGKWLKRASGATVHLLLPLAHQCTNINVEHLI